jgi:predicted nucleic acid-binding Zn ribbon protein
MNYLISFFVLLLTCISYGQVYPKTSVIGSDTVLIFSQEQANQIAQWNEERKYCIENSELLKSEIQQKDTIINSLEGIINEFVVIEDKYKDIIRNKDELQDICNDEKNLLNKEIKRQKRHKWIAIISGITVGVVAIIL